MHPILIHVRKAAARWRVYPACEQSRKIAALAGTKTLTRRTLAAAQAMGFIIMLNDSGFPALVVNSIAP
jgi:hypothetical protein